jgi:hypothetical protein
MNSTIIETQGVEAGSFDKTLKAASLDWEPKSDAVMGRGSNVLMPGKKLLFRSDNKKALGIVGDDYHPSQPREFVKTQFELADSIKGKVVRVGFIDDRSRAFAFVRYGGEITIPKGLRKVGDPLQAYVYTTDGWDGGTPRRSRLYVERLTCLNGMTSKQIAANLWVSHTSGMAKRYEVRWKNFQVELAKQVAIIQQQFAKLAEVRMSEVQCKNFLEKLLPGKGGRVENRRAEILGLFSKGTGNEGVSRWDAYNAVTEYVTHHRNYRETDGTSVETNRFLGVLETDTLSPQALSILLN